MGDDMVTRAGLEPGRRSVGGVFVVYSSRTGLPAMSLIGCLFCDRCRKLLVCTECGQYFSDT